MPLEQPLGPTLSNFFPNLNFTKVGARDIHKTGVKVLALYHINLSLDLSTFDLLSTTRDNF